MKFSHNLREEKVPKGLILRRIFFGKVGALRLLLTCVQSQIAALLAVPSTVASSRDLSVTHARADAPRQEREAANNLGSTVADVAKELRVFTEGDERLYHW